MNSNTNISIIVELFSHKDKSVPINCKYSGYPRDWYRFIYLNFSFMFLLPVLVSLYSDDLFYVSYRFNIGHLYANKTKYYRFLT